jgi:uroporphyrinogen-III synthase
LVYVLDETKQELILRASKKPHPDLLRKIKLKVGEGITGWVAKEKQPVAIARGANQDTRFMCFRSLPEDRFQAFLSVPILTRRGVIGVINVQHRQPHQHSEREINLMAAIGKLTGVAVENALLIEKTYALKEMLESRKVIEKAKGVLMLKRGLNEAEAYRLIQTSAMNERQSLPTVAQRILDNQI